MGCSHVSHPSPLPERTAASGLCAVSEGFLLGSFLKDHLAKARGMVGFGIAGHLCMEFGKRLARPPSLVQLAHDAKCKKADQDYTQELPSMSGPTKGRPCSCVHQQTDQARIDRHLAVLVCMVANFGCRRRQFLTTNRSLFDDSAVHAGEI